MEAWGQGRNRWGPGVPHLLSRCHDHPAHRGGGDLTLEGFVNTVFELNGAETDGGRNVRQQLKRPTVEQIEEISSENAPLQPGKSVVEGSRGVVRRVWG